MIVKAHYPVLVNGKIIHAGAEFEASSKQVEVLNAKGAGITLIQEDDPKPIASPQKAVSKPTKKK